MDISFNNVGDCRSRNGTRKRQKRRKMRMSLKKKEKEEEEEEEESKQNLYSIRSEISDALKRSNKMCFNNEI